MYCWMSVGCIHVRCVWRGTNLNAVVTVGKVVQGLELLVDDADAGLVSAVGDLLDVLGALAHGCEFLVDNVSGLDGGLRVELGCSKLVKYTSYIFWSMSHTRIRHLEENILHHIAAIRTLELELVPPEHIVIETPARRRQDGGNTTLALLHSEHEIHRTLASITSRPRLPRHGIRRVTVRPQTLTINPRLGNSIGRLLLTQAQQLRRDRRRSNLDQHHVVETDGVEGVLQRQHTLDLVGLDHALEHVADLEHLAVAEVPSGAVGARDPVGYGQDTAEVVGGVAPFGGQPAVVVVEPADHGADVEGAVYGVELVGGSGDAGAIGDDRAGHDGAEEFGAGLEFQSL